MKNVQAVAKIGRHCLLGTVSGRGLLFQQNVVWIFCGCCEIVLDASFCGRGGATGVARDCLSFAALVSELLVDKITLVGTESGGPFVVGVAFFGCTLVDGCCRFCLLSFG